MSCLKGNVAKRWHLYGNSFRICCMMTNLNLDFGNSNAKIFTKSLNYCGNMLAVMLYDQKIFNGQVEILGSVSGQTFWTLLRRDISAKRDSCES